MSDLSFLILQMMMFGAHVIQVNSHTRRNSLFPDSIMRLHVNYAMDQLLDMMEDWKGIDQKDAVGEGLFLLQVQVV